MNNENTSIELFSKPKLDITNFRNGNIELTSKSIYSDILNYRRSPRDIFKCEDINCKKCSSIHLSKIRSFVLKNEPVEFVLPAFPGKSPNQEKVLGVLPDFAETQSMLFLGRLCSKIKKYYEPGIKIIICSDGRVFSDVVGMQEEDVTNYQIELDKLIRNLSLEDISTFNLDHINNSQNFDDMRIGLMSSYGKSLDELKSKVKRGNNKDAKMEDVEAHRMYCGITRFLFEDSLFHGQKKSRSAIQKDARLRAYEVIRRSNAWSDLISEKFSNAIRLSIHPQGCGSEKLGIRLIGKECWMTPWHGVALKVKDNFILVKKKEAEKLGAKLVMSNNGRPSHFVLENTTVTSQILNYEI